MGKAAELKRTRGANIAESLGAGARTATPLTLVSKGGPARFQGTKQNLKSMLIPVSKIAPDPDQPRKEFDHVELQRLRDSLKTRGQLQPIVVRWSEDANTYLIVCGERRWRAAKMGAMEVLDAVVLEQTLLPDGLLEIQLVENCLRQDLQPIEQAKAFKTLMDTKGLSVRSLAADLDLDFSAVAKALKLLGLPEPVQELVDSGKIPPTTAGEIVKAPREEQEPLARRVVDLGLTGADLKRERQEKQAKTYYSPHTDADIRREGEKVMAAAEKGSKLKNLLAPPAVPTKTHEFEVKDRLDTALITLCCPKDWSASQRAQALRAAAEQVWDQDRAAKAKPKSKPVAHPPSISDR